MNLYGLTGEIIQARLRSRHHCQLSYLFARTTQWYEDRDGFVDWSCRNTGEVVGPIPKMLLFTSI